MRSTIIDGHSYKCGFIKGKDMARTSNMSV